MALEYFPADLGQVIDNPEVKLTENDIKRIFKGILEAGYFLHRNWVLHRVDFF